MPVPTFRGVGPYPTFEDVIGWTGKTAQDLNELILNLDSLNIKHLTADVIDAGTLNANLVTIRSDLTSGYIQIDGNGLVVNNGLFDTFTVDINGNVTMTSALVRSSTGYPLVVMDPNTVLFGAFTDADDYIEMQANYGGTSSLNFWQGGQLRARLNTLLGNLELYAGNGLLINSQVGITLDGPSVFTDSVTVPSWSDVHNNASNQNLQEAFNTKAQRGLATTSNGAANGGIPIGTQLMTAGGGTVTWNGIPNHTHTQQ